MLSGKPVAASTRITAEHILRHLAAGETEAKIVAGYPAAAEDIEIVAHARNHGFVILTQDTDSAPS